MIPEEVVERIKDDYINGGGTIRALAAKYGIAASTIGKISSQERWKILRDNRTAETKKKILETVDSMTYEQAAQRLMISTAKVCDKLDQILSLDEVLAPRDIKAMTGALLDIKMLFNVRSAEEQRETLARIKKLEKEAEQGSTSKEPITIVFGNGEDLL